MAGGLGVRDGENDVSGGAGEETFPSVVQISTSVKEILQPRSVTSQYFLFSLGKLVQFHHPIPSVQLRCSCYFVIIFVICAGPQKQYFNFLYTYLLLDI